jgi:protein TonB
MERKKTAKADLELKKPVFVQAGLVVALLAVLSAFEFIGTSEKEVWGGNGNGMDIPTEELPIPTTPEKPLPPPPLLPSTTIDVVPDDIPVESLIPVGADSYDGMEEFDVLVDIPDVIETTDAPEPPVQIVEIYPEYPGGEEAMMKFLRDNLVYPKLAREIGLDGKVWIGFVVEKDGSLSNFNVAKGVAPLLDDEALRVVKMMPKWSPGKQRTKTVRVQYQIPITFKLN